MVLERVWHPQALGDSEAQGQEERAECWLVWEGHGGCNAQAVPMCHSLPGRSSCSSGSCHGKSSALNTHAHSSKPLVITRCGGWHFKLNCILPTPGKSCLKP